MAHNHWWCRSAHGVEATLDDIMETDPHIAEVDEARSVSEALDDRAQAMLQLLTCAVPARAATYVSTPITTGRRFVEWRRSAGRALDPTSDAYRAGRNDKVVRPNIDQVAPIVNHLRAAGPAIVIDPTKLVDYARWRQANYHRLWVEVIARFAKRVVFADGWEYSQGCVFEFAQARLSDIQTFDQRMVQLPADVARGLLEAAMRDVKADGVLPHDAIVKALAVLDVLAE
jgi:hypothetical protein